MRMGERVQNQEQGPSEGMSIHNSHGMLEWRAPNPQTESPAGWGCPLSAETKRSSFPGCSGLTFFTTTSLPFTLASSFIKIFEASSHKSAQLPPSRSSPSCFPTGLCLPLAYDCSWEALECADSSGSRLRPLPVVLIPRLGSVLCSAKVYSFCNRFSLMKRKMSTKCVQYILRVCFQMSVSDVS